MNIYSEMKAGKWYFQLYSTKTEFQVLQSYLTSINERHVMCGKYEMAEAHQTITKLITAKIHTSDDLRCYITTLRRIVTSMSIVPYDFISIIKDLTWALSNVGVSV